jgi:hypothetical protein
MSDQRKQPYFVLGRMPVHEHVSCACGIEECEGHIRITVMADGRMVEVLTSDGTGHAGVIVDAADARKIGEIAEQLLEIAREERADSTA